MKALRSSVGNKHLNCLYPFVQRGKPVQVWTGQGRHSALWAAGESRHYWLEVLAELRLCEGVILAWWAFDRLLCAWKPSESTVCTQTSVKPLKKGMLSMLVIYLREVKWFASNCTNRGLLELKYEPNHLSLEPFLSTFIPRVCKLQAWAKSRLLPVLYRVFIGNTDKLTCLPRVDSCLHTAARVEPLW